MMVLITFSPSLHAHVTSVQQGWMHIYEDDTHQLARLGTGVCRMVHIFVSSEFRKRSAAE